MKNKTILITGATGGIGKQTAISLAKLGAKVVVTGRNKESGEKAVLEIKETSKNNNIDLLLADISTIEGIASLASSFNEKHKKLDVLINNAGSATKEFRKTKDGFEFNFAVNVIAPFLLTKSLLENLKQSNNARVITLMGGDLPSKMDLGNLQSEKSFSGLDTYSQTKMTMMCLMYEYAQQYKDLGISMNICYPGQASTNMTQNVTADMLPFLMRPIFPIFKYFVKADNGKSAKKASRSSVFLATSIEVHNKTCLYYNKNVQLTKTPKAVANDENRKFIWEYVNELLFNLVQ